jgi:hypothetical protein
MATTPPTTPKRKKPNTPSSPVTPKTAKRAQSPPPRSVTPKTHAVTTALSRLTTTVSSPERRAKQVRRALDYVETSIAGSARLAENAMRRAHVQQIWKSIEPSIIAAKKLASKNKNKNKK